MMNKNKILILLPMVLTVFTNVFGMEDTMFEERVYDRVVQMRIAREENPNIDPLYKMSMEKLGRLYNGYKAKRTLIRAAKSYVKGGRTAYFEEALNDSKAIIDPYEVDNKSLQEAMHLRNRIIYANYMSSEFSGSDFSDRAAINERDHEIRMNEANKRDEMPMEKLERLYSGYKARYVLIRAAKSYLKAGNSETTAQFEEALKNSEAFINPRSVDNKSLQEAMDLHNRMIYFRYLSTGL